MRYFLTLLACCSGLLAQSPLLDPASWVWGGRDPDLTFEWHAESTTAEYSRGDASGTLNSEAVTTNNFAYDGTNSLWVPTASDRITFAVSSEDIVTADQGTVRLYARVSSTGNGTTLWLAQANSTNSVGIYLQTGEKLRFSHRADATLRYFNTTATYPLDEWFYCEAKWNRGADPSMSVTINSVTQSTNLALGAMSTTPTSLYIGDIGGVAAVMNIDNVRVYNKWK